MTANEWLVEFLKWKNEVIKKYSKETKINLTEEEDYEEILSWSSVICSNIMCSIKAVLNDGTYINDPRILNDGDLCPWCLIEYRIKNHCLCCGYGKRHGICCEDNDMLDLYSVIRYKVLDMPITYVVLKEWNNQF